MRIAKRRSRRAEILIRQGLLASVSTLLAICSTAAYSGNSEVQTGPYQLVASIPGAGADGFWDYATIDAAGRRLCLAQQGVTMFDLESGQVTPAFCYGKTVSGSYADAP